jgi:subtilisin family serine protease
VAGICGIGFLFLGELAGAQRGPAPEPKSDYVVVLRPSADRASEASAVRRGGGRVQREFGHVFSGMTVTLSASAAEALRRNPNVVSVEPDAKVTALTTDPASSWGLDRVDQRNLPLSGTFDYTGTGQGVDVYVIDTGIRSDHVEFEGRLKPGYSSIADGNGTNDCAGHGTHVAGTAAGSNFGLAKSASIVPVRVLDCAGSGSISSVVAGIDWVVSQHSAGVPAIANMSLGGGSSSTIDAAVGRMISDGVVTAVAAGNSNVDACTSSPARVGAALTVGASTSSDARASYSNYGRCLDLFAPGSGIRSAWYTDATATVGLSGTSMASPHVAGAAAVLWADHPELTASGVVEELRRTATTGVVASAGTGSPNLLLYATPAPGTITQPVVTAPAAPTNVTAAAGRRSATVRWTAAADGGSPILSQTVTVYRNGIAMRTMQVSSTATKANVSWLDRASYTFTVRATNAVGVGPESAPSNAVVPR